MKNITHYKNSIFFSEGFYLRDLLIFILKRLFKIANNIIIYIHFNKLIFNYINRYFLKIKF
jgi:hypothetical protein